MCYLCDNWLAEMNGVEKVLFLCSCSWEHFEKMRSQDLECQIMETSLLVRVWEEGNQQWTS